jgi:hypothetical protein
MEDHIQMTVCLSNYPSRLVFLMRIKFFTAVRQPAMVDARWGRWPAIGRRHPNKNQGTKWKHGSCAPSSEGLLRHSADRTKWRSGSTCCNARKWLGAWGREVRPAGRLGSIGSRPCSTLLFLKSDRSAPCANLKERSDFGSGSTRSPCRPTLPSTIYHARQHNILQMLALCLIYTCIPVFAN